MHLCHILQGKRIVLALFSVFYKILLSVFLVAQFFISHILSTPYFISEQFDNLFVKKKYIIILVLFIVIIMMCTCILYIIRKGMLKKKLE